MLLHLDIRNVALIDHLTLSFEKGLNVLTGETGAGKSIIIDSINAVLGDRVSRDLIRTGHDKASIEAVFDIEDANIDQLLDKYGIETDSDGILILSREISNTGKNICRINGRMATVSMLKDIGQNLIDIHGQHDNQSLLRTESHILLLDLFAGPELLKIKEIYTAKLEQYLQISKKINELSGIGTDRERKIDLLEYQLNEIDSADIKPGEDEELDNQRQLLSNSEKILSTLAHAYELVGSSGINGALEQIDKALQSVSNITKYDDKYLKLHDKLQEIYYLLEDTVDGIRESRDSLEYDPALIESVDERLDLIFKLKKKYGQSIEEILEFRRKIEAELLELKDSEELVAKLDKERQSIKKELSEYALNISEIRKRHAVVLENQVTQELEQLEMKKARFKVQIKYDENGKFTSNGLDEVEFLISPNVGEELKPLAKIASGGEMSRIMLAIKKILADVDKVPTLIFDEIDMGISGKAAQKVGEKLSYISRKHQTLCVTHLAQIAAIADYNYLIEKNSSKSTTRTSVKKLDEDGKINEIARIIGGSNLSENTLKLSREMLENAAELKLRI